MPATTFGPGASGRNAGPRRILSLMKRLEGRRYRPSIPKLATELGVTTRTIYRDLALLEELHFIVPPEIPAHFADGDVVAAPAWRHRRA